MIDLPEKKLMRVDEAAKYLDVHPRTIRRWIEHGILEAEKLAGSIRISRVAIVEFRTKGREMAQKVG